MKYSITRLFHCFYKLHSIYFSIVYILFILYLNAFLLSFRSKHLHISRKIKILFILLDMQYFQYKSFDKTSVRLAKLLLKTMVPLWSYTGRRLGEVQIQLSLEVQAIQYGQIERDRFKCI